MSSKRFDKKKDVKGKKVLKVDINGDDKDKKN